MHCHRLTSCLMLLSCLLVLLTGCEREPAGQYVEISGTDDAQKQGMRLVSLAPALSQMVVDLGQSNLLVGVARNDDAAPVGLPIVGDIMDINSEALLATKPTHVLLMLTKEGVPARLKELADRANFQIIAYPSPLSMEEIGLILLDENEFMAGLTGQNPTTGKTPSLGTVLNQQIRAQQLKLTMLMRLGKLGQLTARESRPRVLLVLGTNPLMAVGPGTVHHQLLTTINANNAAGEATVGAPTFDREKLLDILPEVVVFLSPKAAELGDLTTDPRLAIFKGLAIPAVENKRIALVNEPTGMLPSTSIDRVAAALTKAVYPHLAAQVDALMREDFFAGDATNTPTPAATPAPVAP